MNPLKPKVGGVNPPTRQPLKRFVPKCYHCSKMGHIRSPCYHLRSRQSKRESLPPLSDLGKPVLMIKDVVSRLSKLEVSQGVPRGNRNILKEGLPLTLVWGEARDQPRLGVS